MEGLVMSNFFIADYSGRKNINRSRFGSAVSRQACGAYGKKRVMFVISLIIGAVFITSTLSAKEKNFEVTVERNKVALGERVSLYLTFYGMQSMTPPSIKDIDAFQVRYLGPSTMMSIVNGKVENSITHTYTLVPLRVGIFELGPFYFDHDNDTYISGKVTIEVVEEKAQRAAAVSGAEEVIPDLGDRIFLIMEAEKTQAYINEIVPVSIKLYVNRLAVRDIQYPSFGQEGFSKADFGKPKQYRKYVSGIRYDVIEFNTSVFGAKTGEFTLGPAEVKSNLVLQRSRRRRSPRTFDDFFSGNYDDSFFDDFLTRYEKYPITLRSAKLPMKILPLPEKGRPKDFTGAIGDYQFILKTEPANVAIGDPIILKMSIYGNGNFNTVKQPVLQDTKGFKVYEPTVKTENNRRFFEQIIIPESEDIKEIPRVGFSYFDPNRRIYRRIVRGPIPITVTKPEGFTKPAIVSSPAPVSFGPEEEMLGRDIVYIKDSLGYVTMKRTPLYRKKPFLFMQAVPVFLLFLTVILHARSEHLRKDLRYARLLRAPKEAKKGIRQARRFLREQKSEEFYSAVFKTLQGYLGNRLHIPSAGITDHIIEDVLRPKGFDEHIIQKLTELFRDYDAARYVPSAASGGKMESTLSNLEEIIHCLERRKII